MHVAACANYSVLRAHDSRLAQFQNVRWHLQRLGFHVRQMPPRLLLHGHMHVFPIYPQYHEKMNKIHSLSMQMSCYLFSPYLLTLFYQFLARISLYRTRFFFPSQTNTTSRQSPAMCRCSAIWAPFFKDCIPSHKCGINSRLHRRSNRLLSIHSLMQFGIHCRSTIPKCYPNAIQMRI